MIILHKQTIVNHQREILDSTAARRRFHGDGAFRLHYPAVSPRCNLTLCGKSKQEMKCNRSTLTLSSKSLLRGVSSAYLSFWPAYHSFFNNNRAGFPSNCNSKIFIFQSLFLGIFVTNSVMSSVTMTAFFILLTLIGHKFWGGTFLRNFNPNLPAPLGPFLNLTPPCAQSVPCQVPSRHRHSSLGVRAGSLALVVIHPSNYYGHVTVSHYRFTLLLSQLPLLLTTFMHNLIV